MRSLSASVALLLLAFTAVAASGQPSLRAEKTLKYQTDNPIALDVRVGPAKVASLRITLGAPSGFGAAMKAKMAKTDPETQTTFQFAFDTENPNAEQWEVTYTVEFLDTKGTVIDRFTSKAEYEGEAKTSTFEHSMLKAAVPLIDRIRVKFQAAKD